jgi:uncharacterized membrane protein
MRTPPKLGQTERALAFATTHTNKLCLVGFLAVMAGIGALMASAMTSRLSKNFTDHWGNADFGADPKQLTAVFGAMFGLGSLLLVSGVGSVVYSRKRNNSDAQLIGVTLLAVAALTLVCAIAICHMKSRGTETWSNDHYTLHIRPSPWALTGWNVAGGILVGGGLLMAIAGIAGRHQIARHMKSRDLSIGGGT